MVELHSKTHVHQVKTRERPPPIDPSSSPRIQNIAGDQLRPYVGISGRTYFVGTVWLIAVHPHGRLE